MNVQRIGARIDDEGVTFEMDGSVASLFPLLSALIVKFARQLGKAYGDPETWIGVICQKAKEQLEKGEFE